MVEEKRKGVLNLILSGLLFLTKAILLIIFGLIVLILGLIVLVVSIFLLFGVLNSFFGNSGVPLVVNEAKILIMEEINPNVEIFLLTANKEPPFDLNKTLFTSGEVIYPNEEGLKKGDRFAFRVVDGNVVIIPLDNYPYYDVLYDGGAGSGTINNEGKNILPKGSYTIQLVKIDSNNTKATIVAKKDFNIIARYSEEFLSKLEFWLSKDGNPNSSRFQELDLIGIDQIDFAVFGKVPKGEKEVYGRTIMTRENDEGEIFSEGGFWEYSFTLYPGEPQKLSGVSGHPLPGVYHVKIFIDGEVIKEYWVKV